MKLIIAGGRNYDHNEEHYRVVAAICDEAMEVVSGGAPGADRWGEKLAHQLNVPVRVFHADWNAHGKAAGPIRNRQMADYADAVVLLPGGKGTANMAKEAQRAGIWVFDLRGEHGIL